MAGVSQQLCLLERADRAERRRRMRPFAIAASRASVYLGCSTVSRTSRLRGPPDVRPIDVEGRLSDTDERHDVNPAPDRSGSPDWRLRRFISVSGLAAESTTTGTLTVK
jgi:hypothetical protein